MRRHEDWLRQAKRKLKSARWDMEGGFYEDACFSAQQAAELAIKAVLEWEGRFEAGHSISALLSKLGEIPSELKEAARTLDRYYIPSRYPNSFASGAPMDYYGIKEAEEAISLAQSIVEFAARTISGL
ncbi:MAG: HEPN domain-containing protein [Anaerolineae bacterium]